MQTAAPDPAAVDAAEPTPSGRSPGWTVVAVVMVVLAVAAVVYAAWPHSSSSRAEGPTTPNQLVGHPLPELTLTGFDGTTTSTTSLRGRPLVLNLWAATCVPCR